MIHADISRECKSCGFTGTGKFCSNCGQTFDTKRITLHNLLHDVFHFFTHLDKGFGYTVRMLVTSPGTMQRLYVDGERSRHQKPFSMFFICASVSALSRYWILLALRKYYDTGDASESNFFHEYMVIFNLALLPVHILITWLFFYKSKYNYAETGVMLLYTFSVYFLAASLITVLKFIWPHMDTAYIELPVFLTYNIFTFVRFYHKQSKWIVAVKSIILFLAMFALIQLVEDYMIGLIN